MGVVPCHLLAKLLGAWSRLSGGGVGVGMRQPGVNKY